MIFTGLSMVGRNCAKLLFWAAGDFSPLYIVLIPASLPCIKAV